MSTNGPYISETQTAQSTPFDETTGHGFNNPAATDVQAALEHLRDHTIYISRTQASSAAGTLTLTSSDVNLQYVTGTAVGYTVKMPDATTLALAAYYQIINSSTQSIDINNGSGTLLFSLSSNSIGFLTLQLNGTAAGTWVWWQVATSVASGIVTYNITSTTTFATSANADTLITGMSVTPIAGTYGIWYSATVTGAGAGQTLDTTIYAGASGISDSIRHDSSPSGTHIFTTSTQTIHTFDGATTCNIKVNANGNSMTVNNRSMLLIRFGA